MNLIMSEINITYEALYEILRKEKNSDELQKLDENFFENVSEYIKTKKEILASQESKDSIFKDVEAPKTRKQIEQIQKILKEIYERREHKILQLALFSSRTNSTIKEENLLDEELDLFIDINTKLKSFKNDIFNRFNGEIPKKEEPKELKSQDNKDSLKLIRVIQPIPKFIGDDMNIYGPLEANDVVSISEDVANLLVNNKKAEFMKNESS